MTVQRILDCIRDGGLLGPATEVVAMCSGGRDSTCLLDVCVTLCGAGHVRALHVNYGLRGADSDADEAHVRTLCATLDVELSVMQARRATEATGNLQSWARDIRYAAAAELAGGGETLIAAGHTASDQAEGMLYRLAASPGRRALLGMAARDGRLVRPLLVLSREETEAYCVERGLSWRDDVGNVDERYARTRVRTQVLPAMRELHPAAIENLNRTAALLREEGAVLDELVHGVLGGEAQIAVARLGELEPALRRLVVVRLAEDAAGTLVPGAGARVEELLALAPRGGSAELDVGAGVRAVVEYGVLRMEAGEREPPILESVPLALPGSALFGGWRLECDLGEAQAGDGAAVALLDADALEQPLCVRAWRAGDRMQPVGLGGHSRTLADLFTDRRVPRARRRTLPLVLCGDAVAWVPGVATAERFRATAQTRRTAVVRARLVNPA